jgi:hypothetical protein
MNSKALSLGEKSLKSSKRSLARTTPLPVHFKAFLSPEVPNPEIQPPQSQHTKNRNGIYGWYGAAKYTSPADVQTTRDASPRSGGQIRASRQNTSGTWELDCTNRAAVLQSVLSKTRQGTLGGFMLLHRPRLVCFYHARASQHHRGAKDAPEGSCEPASTQSLTLRRPS